MKHRTPNRRLQNHRKPATSPRSGFSITEAVVACGVLAVILPTMTSLFVSSRRLMQQTRHERLVLDEVSNQLEVLAIDPEQVQTDEPRQLSLSDTLEHALPSASLSAQRVENDSGQWMQVTAKWIHGENPRSVSLARWMGEVER